jgi:hypothetical protein
MKSVLSQLRKAGYDIGLQGESIVLEYVGEGQPDAAVVEPLIEEVTAHKAEMTRCLSEGHTHADAKVIEQSIRSAQAGADLEVVCDDIQHAYSSGQIDVDAAAALATYNSLRARVLYHVEHPESWSLDEFARSGRSLRIKSRVLGEVFLLLADNGKEPAGNCLPVYRASEARQLLGATPEELRKVHQVKTAVGGELIEYSDENVARIYSADLIRPPRPAA